jgi:hypothetical protein
LWWEGEVVDTSDGEGQDSEEEEEEHEEDEGHYEGEARHYEDEVVGCYGSALGSASSCRYKTSHLVRPPVAPHEDNRVVNIPSDDA